MKRLLIYGKEIRERIKARVKEQADITPMAMAIIQVGDNEASRLYVRSIEKFGFDVGIKVELFNYPDDTSHETLAGKIEQLNLAPEFTGIMLQTPLPSGLNYGHLVNSIVWHKEVEGLHNYNLGRLLSREEGVKPSTPKAVMSILKGHGVDMDGQKVTIVGRSLVVGSPLAVMMTRENATIRLCHSHTHDLAEETRGADIVVVAVGKPNLITADMVKDECVIIDVGINFDENGQVIGDVSDAAKARARLASAVPGGIGVLTVAELFDNLCILKRQDQG
ncbi:MAG: bifunctional 5,10-methylenetetrahydrofolate dehydrogenase/5,10-methenyltetrahydrofolate cyclohydrolase [Syntrophomonadaceae bacterium]|nr:bifunctional 5,10-methylenetetrahydrofolate dehydrogenase/5,10-methenyltetrahydrofolate cyclohydrolase [Syntrophomonadaceae bacterium]